MKSKRDKYNVPLEDEDEFGQFTDGGAMNVISGGECTGLVPTPPLNGEEADAYREIYDVPVVKSEVNTPSHFPQKTHNGN